MRRRSYSMKCRGSSLVELVAVMVAGTALMGVTIAALVAVQRADRRFSRNVSSRQSLGLLADQLRVDIHAAQRVLWDADANRLVLSMPAGGSVTYELASNRWERYVNDRPDQPRQLAGAFRAPTDAACSVTPAVIDAGALVNIAWNTPATSDVPQRTGPRRDDVVATVGRDLDLLHK